MTKPTHEQKKELRMTIKSISFDLDDTFWPLMPTIMEAEKNSRNWIKDNYPGVLNSLTKEASIEIRDKLLRTDPSLMNRLSELRLKIFYDASIRSGYNNDESQSMAEGAFKIFFEGRNNVTFYDHVISTLDILKDDYSLGVITNGNADLDMIGISDYFDYILSPAELNAHKPNPEMFEAALEATGLEAKEICHIGDHPINDVQASYDFGCKPIWFNENEGELELDIQVPSFSDWRELPALLKTI